MTKIALDTNILIYLHDENKDSHKRNTANKLTTSGPIISSQVISEYLNVCNKRLKMTKQSSLDSLMACDLIVNLPLLKQLFTVAQSL